MVTKSHRESGKGYEKQNGGFKTKWQLRVKASRNKMATKSHRESGKGYEKQHGSLGLMLRETRWLVGVIIHELGLRPAS